VRDRSELWAALEEACEDLTHYGADAITGPVHAANVGRKAADYLKAVEPPMPKEAQTQKTDWRGILADPDIRALIREKGLQVWVGGEQGGETDANA
jgi:hypothetical protein